MKRIARKLIVICLGLSLGWTAAGLVGGFPSNVYAAEKKADAAGGDHPTEDGEYHPHDAAGKNVQHGLVPESEQITFFRPVLLIIAGLFIAALVVGIAGKAMGVRDPGIAATEEDNAEAHDDHH